MKRIGVFACLLLVVTSVCGKTAEEWKSRVIYQILTDRFGQETDPATACSDLTTYCGGTFKGILKKLDYIQGMGFNAIWFSSFVEQTTNGYHGYWHRNLDNTNGQFGSSDDLKKLVNECHNRGIWVMLDVVPNHMGNQADGDWDNFKDFYPFDKAEYYHPYCNIDFDHDPSQNEKEMCRLANLPDLDQSHEFVRTTLKNWVKNTVAEYGFDGVRCDAVPHIAKDFWKEYAEAAGVYQVGEVFHDDASYVAGYQGSLDALLNFPMFYKLENAFQKKQTMRNIHDGFEANRAHFPDISVLGNFLDNHDTARFLSQNNDWSTLKNALAYIVFAEGIPVMYYGTEQAFAGSHDPNNRESLWPHYDTSHMMYVYISQIVKFRNQQGPAMYLMKQIERYVDDQFFAFTRGYVFVATSNIGSGRTLSRTITYHDYTEGTKLVNLLDKSDVVTVNEQGSFPVNIQNGQPKIYYPQAMDTGGDGYCLIPGTCG